MGNAEYLVAPAKRLAQVARYELQAPDLSHESTLMKPCSALYPPFRLFLETMDAIANGRLRRRKNRLLARSLRSFRESIWYRTRASSTSVSSMVFVTLKYLRTEEC